MARQAGIGESTRLALKGNAMNYYRLHIGDYLRDTAHLSLLEHGVYARLLQVYYTREAPIGNAERYRLVGARTDDECAAVDSVLGEFFALIEGVWVQSRCDREIAEYQTRADRNREVGRLGGRPVSKRNPEITQTVSAKNPNVTLASSQEPIAIEEEQIESAKRSRAIAADAAPSVRGCRIPDDFPTADAVAWCMAERPDLQADVVREKFRDYWLGVPGQRGRKLDWPATWRNFVRGERPGARASPVAVEMQARRQRESAFIRELTGRQADDRETIDVQPQFARIA
jgi:uncharacterized protein YdaU (DUF1376 family)